jgi:hypothetical protein
MPISYFEPWSPAYQPSSELETEYKGFKIRKRIELNLYCIICPDGKELHKSLEGDYTKMELLKGQIDRFLEEHGTIHAAFIDMPEPKRGRGRPKRIMTLIEELVAKSETEDN